MHELSVSVWLFEKTVFRTLEGAEAAQRVEFEITGIRKPVMFTRLPISQFETVTQESSQCLPASRQTPARTAR